MFLSYKKKYNNKRLVKNKKFKKFNFVWKKYKIKKRFIKRRFFFSCKRSIPFRLYKYKRFLFWLRSSNIFTHFRRKRSFKHFFFYKNFSRIRDIFFVDYLFTLKRTHLFRLHSRFFRVIYFRNIFLNKFFVFQKFSRNLLEKFFFLKFYNFFLLSRSFPVVFHMQFRLQFFFFKKYYKKLFHKFVINLKEKRKRLFFYNRAFLFRIRSGLKSDERFLFKVFRRLRFKKLFKNFFFGKQIFRFKKFFLFNSSLKRLTNLFVLRRYFFFRYKRYFSIFRGHRRFSILKLKFIFLSIFNFFYFLRKVHLYKRFYRKHKKQLDFGGLFLSQLHKLYFSFSFKFRTRILKAFKQRKLGRGRRFRYLFKVRLKNTFIRTLRLSRFFFRTFALSKRFLFLRFRFHFESPKHVRFENPFYLWFRHSRIRIFRRIRKSRYNDVLVLRLKALGHLKHWARLRGVLQRSIFFKLKLFNILGRQKRFFLQRFESKNIYWRTVRFLSSVEQYYLHTKSLKLRKKSGLRISSRRLGYFLKLRLNILYYYKLIGKFNKNYLRKLKSSKFYKILKHFKYKSKRKRQSFFLRRFILIEKGSIARRKFFFRRQQFKKYRYLRLFLRNILRYSDFFFFKHKKRIFKRHKLFKNFKNVLKIFYLRLSKNLKKFKSKKYYRRFFFKARRFKNPNFRKRYKNALFRFIFKRLSPKLKVGFRKRKRFKNKLFKKVSHLIFRRLGFRGKASLSQNIFLFSFIKYINLYKFKRFHNQYIFNSVNFFFSSQKLNAGVQERKLRASYLVLKRNLYLYFKKFRYFFFFTRRNYISQHISKKYVSLDGLNYRLMAQLRRKIFLLSFFYNFPIKKEFFFNSFFHILRKWRFAKNKFSFSKKFFTTRKRKKRRRFYTRLFSFAKRRRSLKVINSFKKSLKRVLIKFKRTPFKFNYFFYFLSKPRRKRLKFRRVVYNKAFFFNFVFRSCYKFKLFLGFKRHRLRKLRLIKIFKFKDIISLIYKYIYKRAHLYGLVRHNILRLSNVRKKKFLLFKFLIYYKIRLFFKKYRLFSYFIKRFFYKLKLQRKVFNWFPFINKLSFLKNIVRTYITSIYSYRYFYFFFSKFYSKLYNFVYPTSVPLFLFLNKGFFFNDYFSLAFFNRGLRDNFFNFSCVPFSSLYMSKSFKFGQMRLFNFRFYKFFKNNRWIYRGDYFFLRRFRFLVLYKYVKANFLLFNRYKVSIHNHYDLSKFNLSNVRFLINEGLFLRQKKYDLLIWKLIFGMRYSMFFQFVINFFKYKDDDLIFSTSFSFPFLYDKEKTGMNYELFFKSKKYNFNILPYIKRVLRTRRFNIRTLLRLPQRSVSIFKRRAFSDFFRFKDASFLLTNRRASFLFSIYRNSLFNFRCIVGRVVSIIFQKALRHYYVVFDYGMKKLLPMPLVASYSINTSLKDINIERARYDFRRLIQIKFGRLFNFVLKRNRIKFFRTQRYLRFLRKRGFWRIWYDYFILSMRIKNTTFRMRHLRKYSRKSVLYKNKKLFDFIYRYSFNNDIRRLGGSLNVLRYNSLSALENGRVWSIFKLSKFFYKRFIYNFNIGSGFDQTFFNFVVSVSVFSKGILINKLLCVRNLMYKFYNLRFILLSFPMIRSDSFVFVPFFKLLLFFFFYFFFFKYFLLKYFKYYIITEG